MNDNIRLSASSNAVLDYVKSYLKNKGYSPTIREICEGVGLHSTSTVHGHLHRLKEKGLLSSEDYRTRTMRVNNGSDDADVLRRENKQFRGALEEITHIYEGDGTDLQVARRMFKCACKALTGESDGNK